MRNTIGYRIQEMRKKNKLTQSDLAGDFISLENLIEIEEDKAKPSKTTLSYFANRLHVDVDFLVNEKSKIEELASIAQELMSDYQDNQCQKIIERLNTLKSESPMLFHNDFVKDVYINTYFKYGSYLTKKEEFEEALICYEILLEFEHEFILDNELVAYELYTKLVDTHSLCGNNEKALEYNKKAKNLIKKMMAAKEVQNLYLLMTSQNYREVVDAYKTIEVDMLDDYNKAKMHMVLGNAFFNMKHYKTAVDFLLLAIQYYEEKTYNSLTIMMYEELSKCYSNLDEHELAVEYMIKAKKSQEERHQFS